MSHVLIIMLSVVMLSVIILSVVMLSVIMLSVVMLNVKAPNGLLEMNTLSYFVSLSVTEKRVL